MALDGCRVLQAKLSIFIPSFQRVEEAGRMATSILDQIEDYPVSLTILDNGSDENYREYFRGNSDLSDAIDDGRLKVISNEANIGMSANFLRCFEKATGEWLWIVSDDDDLREGSLGAVLRRLNDVRSEVGLIKFSSQRSRPSSDHIELRNFEELVTFVGQSVDDFNGFIFISNLVFRRSEFLPYLSEGYLHSHTYIPHFMMIVAYLQNGGRASIFRQGIVEYVQPKVGYSYSLVAGLGVGGAKFVLHNLGAKHAKMFYSAFFPHNDFKVLIDLYYLCKSKQSQASFWYFSKCYRDNLKGVRSRKKIWALWLFSKLAAYPQFFELLVERGLSSIPKYAKHINEIQSRYRAR